MSTTKLKKMPNLKLPHGWIKKISKRKSGRYYYYNTISKQSTWTHPCEGSEYHNINSTAIKEKKVDKVTEQSPPTIHLEPNSEIEDYDEAEDDFFMNELSDLLGSNKKNSQTSSIQSGCSMSKEHASECSASSTKVKNNPSDFSSPKIQKVKLFNNNDCTRAVSIKKGIGTHKKSSCNALSLIKKNYSSQVSLKNKNIISTNCTKTIKSPENEKVKKKSQAKPKKNRTNTINNAAKHLQTCDQQNFNNLLQISYKIPEKVNMTVNNKSKNLIDKAKQVTNPDREGTNSKENDKNLDSDGNFEKFEEMDWEPCDEESVAKNINEFCLQMNCAEINPSNICCEINTENLVPQQSEGILVLDTNILISCLSFVQEILEKNNQILGLPVVYIPWRVLQELDHLKKQNFGYKTKLGDKNLCGNARKAIMYLNENFKSRNPRFFGQSFVDSIQIMDNGTCIADDEILQTCIQLSNSHNEKKVILITNDKNLETKAHINNLEAYSKDEFQDKYLCYKGGGPQSFNDNKIIMKNVSGTETHLVSELKNVIRETLSVILETEMKMAFDNDWVKVCFKKPPWTLKDVLDCWKKHWRSVFFLVFNKTILQDIEELTIYLQVITATSQGVWNLNTMTQKLLKNIKSSLMCERSYIKIIDAALLKLSNFYQEANGDSAQVKDDELSTAQEVSLCISKQKSTNQEIFELENEIGHFNEVKHLFWCIWDSVKNFCDTLSEVIGSPVINNNLCIPETRHTLMHKHNEIVQLKTLIEQVFELNIQDITESHAAINQLSNFLQKTIPTMEEKLRSKLTKCLVVFFRSPEGRLLLSRSVTDFIEFSQKLINANDFIARTLSKS